jgi:DNA-binding MarR family transcriptional regulator
MGRKQNRSDTTGHDAPLALDFTQTVELLADFRMGLRRFLSFSESILSAVGISSPQYQALLIIVRSRDDGVTVGALAKELLLVPHGAVQIVNRLSEAGLVVRRSDADDARISQVHVTPKGLLLMKTLVKAHAGELRDQERLLRKSLDSLRAATDDTTR